MDIGAGPVKWKAVLAYSAQGDGHDQPDNHCRGCCCRNHRRMGGPSMTPLPRPTSTLRPMRADNPIPMTSAQYLRWRARRRLPTLTIPTPAEADAAVAMLQGMPYWRDVVEAAAAGTPGDDIDAAYLAAIRMAPAVVGTGPGQVPMEVARRLYLAGLIVKQK